MPRDKIRKQPLMMHIVLVSNSFRVYINISLGSHVTHITAECFERHHKCAFPWISDICGWWVWIWPPFSIVVAVLSLGIMTFYALHAIWPNESLTGPWAGVIFPTMAGLTSLRAMHGCNPTQSHKTMISILYWSPWQQATTRFRDAVQRAYLISLTTVKASLQKIKVHVLWHLNCQRQMFWNITVMK